MRGITTKERERKIKPQKLKTEIDGQGRFPQTLRQWLLLYGLIIFLQTYLCPLEDTKSDTSLSAIDNQIWERSSGGLGFLIWRSTIKLYLFHVSSKDQGVLHHMVWCSWCTSDLLDSRLHVKSGWSTECITSSGSGDSNSSTTCEQNHWKREIIWAIDGHISF